MESLSRVADENGIRLFFDAAHAFGSTHGGAKGGRFGDAEVFSLSPTKVVIAAEGGVISTNDDLLAERCRIGRDYGNPGDYDCRFVGLNARMSELHAATALHSLEVRWREHIARRNDLARRVPRGAVPDFGGDLRPPRATTGRRSPLTRTSPPHQTRGSSASMQTGLGQALEAVGVETRRYYSPPVHKMRAYERLAAYNGSLAVTERSASQTLTLPMWFDMTEAHVAQLRMRSPG